MVPVARRGHLRDSLPAVIPSGERNAFVANGSETGQYVLLPPRGLRAKGTTASPEAQEFLRMAHDAPGPQAVAVDGGQVSVHVVDSIGPDGAKLVELTPEAALALRAQRPDLRLVPVVYYLPAVAPPQQVESGAPEKGAAAAADITLQVVSKKGSAPI